MRKLKISDGFIEIPSPYNSITAGIIGRKNNITDYSSCFDETRKAEKKILQKITGIKNQSIIFLDQEHKDKILTIDNYPEEDNLYAAVADASITSLKNVCLVIRTADCVPVLFYDPKKNIIAAAHSGWKGTKLEISSKTIALMATSFGSAPDNIHVFILPSIGVESYEVNKDVAQFFPNHTENRDGKIYVNLNKHIEDSLKKNGIKESNIFNSEICNFKHNKDFFSHRRGDVERNLNFIFMKT